MSLARRNLFQDKTRLALSVGGVALAVMLILILKGFLAGMNRQITSYIDRSSGSIVVAQEDVVNLLGATSLLPEGILQKAEAIRGVEEAVPVLSQFIILDLHGKKQPAYMIGYEPNQGGGPWELIAGREPRSKKEIVFDRVLAQRHDLNLGDQVEVMGTDFTIVGLSNGTTSWMTSFFFVRKRDAENLLMAPGATSFLLLTTEEGADTNRILQRLNDFSGVNALTKQEMAANDLKLFAKVFSAPLRLMVGIAFLVGTMIVGLIIYTATVERQREYGVIKAIGAQNRFLYRIVVAQALFASIVGSLLGVLLANGAAQWIMSAKPQFLIIFDPVDGAQALLAGLGMALLASVFPTRVVANLAPAEVFRK
ncbi:MAG: FtsX-like permease family protein [Chloroflexi bacterium]|nr:FtsX-like permease family protein [Chloroflexota bacterium]